jgi:general secretion pathway protein M
LKNSNLKEKLAAARKKLGLGRLEKREKYILLFGVIFVSGFVLFQTMLMPYLDARNTMKRSLSRNEGELVDIQMLRKEYLELKSRQGDIEKRLAERSPGFSLFSFLEEQAAAARVKDRVTYMKPTANEIDEGFNESIVEMKIEKVTLDQLVSFLLKIESAEKIVSVQRISIQESSQENGLLDTVLSIKTFETNRSS